MEWRKLKNIILLILLGLNVALALLIGGPALSDSYRATQADREAVAFLEQKGITVEEKSIPSTEELLPKIVQRDREQEAQLARQLLGEDVEQHAQGGEVYRYTSARGTVQFHSDGSFWASLAPEAFPLNGNAREAALTVLERLGFSGQVEEEEQRLTVCQTWDGLPLFNQQATVVWNETGVTDITAGRRLYGTPLVDNTRQTITLATALIDFYNGLNQMGDVCSRVDAIMPGYLSATALNRPMTLTPVWRVTTDTGAYQLDLVSGALDRVG